METFLIIFMNLLVGTCIGLTGIAGFLLPMFYTGFLGMSSTLALAYSFSAFLISGILGSINYKKSGNLDITTGTVLSAGSFAGAVLGVKLNLLIPEDLIKLLLYLVVLLSGLSILVKTKKTASSPQKQPCKNQAAQTEESRSTSSRHLLKSARQYKFYGYLLLGLATGSVCAASGAGGPVLVMPLLTVIGFPVHTAVGISLFNSIFIALPSAAGYLYAAFGNAVPAQGNYVLILPILLAHGIGVMWGSKNAVKVNQELLKKIVAAVSIAVACLKLCGIL